MVRLSSKVQQLDSSLIGRIMSDKYEMNVETGSINTTEDEEFSIDIVDDEVDINISDQPIPSPIWKCCGHKLPKEEIVFFVQIIPIYIVIICSICHLAFNRGNENIWTVLLGSAVGYILPNPTLKKQHEK